jgi:chorismate mutase
LVLAVFLPLPTGGCGTFPPDESRLNSVSTESIRANSESEAGAVRLFELMGERLGLMHEVALWKWTARKPIADPARERELLDQVAQLGQSSGLAPDFTRRFFAAQIEAGKLVQRDDFERWRTAPPTAQPGRDLSLVRQDIDALNKRIVETLAALAPRLASSATHAILNRRCAQVFKDHGITDQVRAMAITPLRLPRIQ